MATKPQIQQLRPSRLPQLLQADKPVLPKVQAFKVGHLDPVDALNRLDPVGGQIDASEVGEVDG